jgi:hypothetical protein
MCLVTNYVEFCFQWKKLIPKFQSYDMIKHIIYDMSKLKFLRYFILLYFHMAFEFKYFLKFITDIKMKSWK